MFRLHHNIILIIMKFCKFSLFNNVKLNYLTGGFMESVDVRPIWGHEHNT